MKLSDDYLSPLLLDRMLVKERSIETCCHDVGSSVALDIYVDRVIIRMIIR